MFNHTKKVMGGVIVIAGVLAASVASAQNHPQAHSARVALDVARRTALARVPGRIRHEELEREHGRWIYSFEIVAGPHGIEEVNVDSDTGVIVDVGHEND